MSNRMMNRCKLVLIAAVVCMTAMITPRPAADTVPIEIANTVTAGSYQPELAVDPVVTDSSAESESSTVSDVEEVVSKQQTSSLTLTEEEIELIALVTMAEAEGECEEGKRLVIDTILNRVDSKRFPNTVHGVVYQKNAFSSMWTSRVDRCYVRDDICQLVREELISRTNYDVVFFQMYKYSRWGKPMFKLGCHYFSSY